MGIKYDFDKVINRYGTASYKWDQSEKLFGRADLLPLWVADMDFEPPHEVVEAIKERANQGIYGYTIRTKGYHEAVEGWLLRRHGWQIQHDWISSSPGVVPALSLVVQAFTKPGDSVILQSPVYYPFYDVIRMNDRVVVDNALVLKEGRYEMDFDLLEKQAAEGAKLLLLCTPHNPGGRVWTREELERVAEICIKHGVLVVADEIHHDLVYSGHKHTPFSALSEEIAQQTITCIATSKTFNLAGLQAATVIIPNDKIRNKYNYLLKTLSIHMESYFGLTAVESAYNHGDEWLDQLIPYLEENVNLVLAFVQKRLPQIKAMKPEGTYMVWLDCRAISEDPQKLKKLMFEQAGVAFSEGSVFGKQGAGYLRINVACPRSILTEALERFAAAIEAIGE
ncbi:aminotransferase class I and II [Paenibacillus curdlanolyticus YK9]|uniref:cysteine-S-conjugate beta-lyase n=1 Tax=Paenibacillus curdlanolyticus YK9 TaxID=717606 RepID=E0IBD5_9BACL|nr:MalY/PatB family protein [Paenibacillus curdlanolyticus]EFM10015.1 aminotransferase class I and II [Paenibacillus curdlanolyticus YK9]